MDIYGSENQLSDAASQSDESYYPGGVTFPDEKRDGCGQVNPAGTSLRNG